LAGSCISPDRNTAWRFIDDGERSGAFNMARDEAVARSVCLGYPPTLRVYRFKPAAISIGRFQQVCGCIDLAACERKKIEVVRRPTGGLAILHLDDFTYSVSLPRQQGTIDPKDRYFALVADGILETLLQLGIEGRVVSHRGKGVRPSIWCFDGAFGVDIEWRGRKICGSAQRLYREAVLQHGSFFISVNNELREQIVAACQDVAKAGQQSNTFVSLLEAAGRAVTWEQVRLAFLEGFSKSLLLDIVPGRLSENEEFLAERLYETKYATDDWLLGKGP